MAKEEVRAALDDSWRSLKRALELFNAEDMVLPGVRGEWSVRDLIEHIADCEEIVTQALLTGRAVGDEADGHERQRIPDSAPADVSSAIQRLDMTHRALKQSLRDAPESLLANGHPVRRLVDRGAVLHYEEHGDEIRTWSADMRRRARG